MTVYTQSDQALSWIERHGHCPPAFVCVLGFTDTGLIPGISAAGKTPADRKFTAIADAEFLVRGTVAGAKYPLPPLISGVSPVFITKALVDALNTPVYLFNSGLPVPPSVSAIDLGGQAARCVSTGQALPLQTVEHLFQQSLRWGEKLARAHADGYLVLSECVVGGTTTALGILLGLGIAAGGKVNSSHPHCNHQQKLALVHQGLSHRSPSRDLDPIAVVAAVGDPMQIVVAGMAIAASRSTGVMLAGGTQMLAVYALIQALARQRNLAVDFSRLVVGTTKWVCEDASGDTVGLANLLSPVPLLASQLSFVSSVYPQLQVYEQGFVKEGVGAGAMAIAAHLYKNWGQEQLLELIENLIARELGQNKQQQ
ncbi:Nicotinate-nucleotide--dimethylbenzimidazole phosphoribosyltransferase [Synechocystis sp. PCC 6714]|nr:Nicotinate-nucleotide--dimethylbenzimidazole phosphoribosyltransferase [Synechocystis sp. PCC 6714]